MSIFAVSLGKTKATTILYELKSVSHRYLLFRNNVIYYERKIVENKPTHIVALGLFTGRDHNHIRIETVCQINGVSTTIPYAFFPDDHFIEAKSIGTGLCNFYTATLVNMVRKNHLSSTVTFLHIPKKMNALVASSYIEQQLAKLSDAATCHTEQLKIEL